MSHDNFPEIREQFESILSVFDQRLESVRRQTTEKLNSVARRIRQAESREDAVRALLDGAGEFASKVLLFSIAGTGLRYEGEPFLTIPLSSAAAFANAIESKDTVVAAATSSELSKEVTSLLG